MEINSEQVNFYKQQINNGDIITNKIFYVNDPKLRKAGILYKCSESEIEIYTKCAEQEMFFYETFFANKYKLYDMHMKYLNLLSNDKHVINLNSRESGALFIHALHFLWLSIFKNDTCNVIVDYKRDVAIEHLHKIMDLYSELPYYMQVGIKHWNQTSIKFDNGSQIRVYKSNACFIGFNVDNLLINNFAFLDVNFLKKFKECLYPTISAHANSSIIINSEPNGKNLFHDMFEKAKSGLNKFVAFEMPYYIIPNRDEKWKSERIANIGEKSFKQEYELCFIEEESEVINKEDLMKELKEIKSLYKKLIKKIDTIN